MTKIWDRVSNSSMLVTSLCGRQTKFSALQHRLQSAPITLFFSVCWYQIFQASAQSWLHKYRDSKQFPKLCLRLDYFRLTLNMCRTLNTGILFKCSYLHFRPNAHRQFWRRKVKQQIPPSLSVCSCLSLLSFSLCGAAEVSVSLA